MILQPRSLDAGGFVGGGFGLEGNGLEPFELRLLPLELGEEGSVFFSGLLGLQATLFHAGSVALEGLEEG